MMWRFLIRDLRGSGRTLWVFCACLVLGVTLIAASGGLMHQVRSGLLADTRALFGGDIEIEHRQPLDAAERAWLDAHGTVSRLVELRTMLRTEPNADTASRTQVVELLSVDSNYPLYGRVELSPSQSLDDALAYRDAHHGVAIDPVLAQRLEIAPGDRVRIGALSVEVRALITRQPDRSLRADWRGLPVLLSDAALEATDLLRPGSLVEYEYRVRTTQDLDQWQADALAAFPDAQWEISTFAQRSERMTEILDQVGSVLLLIGLSALFIGGLGVANSVQAYLQSKLATLATLRALGLRERRLSVLYAGQILLLAALASLVGVAIGAVLALFAARLSAEQLPLAPVLSQLVWPLAASFLLGLLTALSFALPALGRAVSITPAALFRGIDPHRGATPPVYRRLTALVGALSLALVLVFLPQPLFGLVFIAVALTLLVLLEGIVRLLRSGAQTLADGERASASFAWRLALSNVSRPGSTLRPTLLSLGSSLTLLVASTLVVASLLRMLESTIAERAPAMVFYDIAPFQTEPLRASLSAAPSLERIDLAPLVLGRLVEVNDESIAESADAERAAEARDEHKLSYRQNNFDQVIVDRGAWWPTDYAGPALVAMEDREADQLGLVVGDRLRFSILGKSIDATLAAIYRQRRFESRFWLEGIFSDGVLDPFITRYIGTAYLSHEDAIERESDLAQTMPNVVTVRTQGLLQDARQILRRASAGLALVGTVSLAASLLVLIGVMASNRHRQLYDATVLHVLGARLTQIRAALRLEYALVAVLTSLFAVLLGGAIAYALLVYRLELPTAGVGWMGIVVAASVSALSLAAGSRYLLSALRHASLLTLLRQRS